MAENKISLNELKKVVGGANKKPNGMKCPRCDSFIPISIEQITQSRALYCPVCGLRLEIDPIRSQES